MHTSFSHFACTPELLVTFSFDNLTCFSPDNQLSARYQKHEAIPTFAFTFFTSLINIIIKMKLWQLTLRIAPTYSARAPSIDFMQSANRSLMT
ncbi:hypothetical protein QBC32DRAFT_406140, partial [Pseudoneurospora amorphoporcata]